MILKCEICGCEFDHTNAAECNCGFDCGGAMLRCPECGLDVDVPPELRAEVEKKQKEQSIFTKIEKEINKN